MSPRPSIESLEATACEAARLAGAELIARRRSERTVELKGSIDLVTDADRAAEEKIVRLIGERFADHAVLAEERGAMHGREPYRWLVDPLDGTTNYAHGVPHFCVSIAVEDEQGLAAAAVYDPVRDELFSAGRGTGARLDGRAMSVSRTASLGRALLSSGFPYDVWERPELPLGLFDAFVRRAQGMRRCGSAALDLSYVASGRYDGFFEARLKPWDIAAGALLVSEAGGRVSDLTGGPLDLAAGDVLVSNGALHEAMLSLSREVHARVKERGSS